MKPPKWSTYCPECKTTIRLPVTVTPGPKIRGKEAVEARVKVDVGPMREHMKDAHGIVPAVTQGT